MVPMSTDFVRLDQLISFLDPRYKDLRAETDIETEKIKFYIQKKISYTCQWIIMQKMENVVTKQK